MNNILCSILISNKDTRDSIQLCIESIRRYTNYRDYRIIVYDDGSTNGIDVEYLKQARERGWINEVIFGPGRLEWQPSIGHGMALNVLINKVCQTPLAMIIDSDIHIKDYNWLSELVGKIDMEKDLAVCDIYPKGMFTVQGYRAPNCDLSFGLINMEAYRDNMQVNWEPRNMSRKDEPFLSLFSDIYPPEKSEWFRRKGDKERFQKDQVIIDVGSNLWMKASYDNPKEYRIIPIPKSVRKKYVHFGHMSILCRSYDTYKEDKRFSVIKTQLKKLREANETL